MNRNLSVERLLIVLAFASQTNNAFAEIKFQELKRAAAEVVRSRTVRITFPTFQVDNGTLYWDFGNAMWQYPEGEAYAAGGGELQAQNVSDHKAFLDELLQIEVVRQYRISRQTDVFLQPYLQRAEQEIAGALADYDAANTDERREAALRRLYNSRGQLHQAQSDYASRHGLRLPKGGAAQRGAIGAVPKPDSVSEMLVVLIGFFDSQPHIDRANAVLNELTSAKSPQARHEREFQLWEIYGELEAIAATNTNANVVRQKVALVEIETNPLGGQIFLMPTLEPYLARVAGRRPRWTKISQGHAPMGHYFYFVHWRGSGASSGPIRTVLDDPSRKAIFD